MKNNLIFTLNARDNVYFDVFRQISNPSNERLNSEIHRLFTILKKTLHNKGVNYFDLKSSLVPNSQRNEIAFLFDSTKIEASAYGCVIFDTFLKLLNRENQFSVFHGDLLPRANFKVREMLEMNLIKSNDYNYQHPTQFFCIYVNNFTDNEVKRFHEGLDEFKPYVGYIHVSESKIAREYFSFTVNSSFIKFKDIIITAHEDDLSNDDDVNTLGYSFEKHGFKCKSLQTYLYILFLSYKIEREVYEGFTGDTEISLAAFSNKIKSLKDFNIK